jgi:biopolymer transport protein ExbD
MKSRGVPKSDDKIPLDMTSMIDIVFQLLAFFILTFKVVSLEGDFDIKMPQASAAGPTNIDDLTVPMDIQLIADANGNLADIRVNDERSFASFDELHRHVVTIVGSEGGPTGEGSSQEATIAADYNLKWSETIAALTAISGYVVDDDGKKEVVKLIQNVKFKPPEAPPGG